MKRYAAYKDSGIEWIGEIPEEWICPLFKRIISENDGGIWGNDPKDDDTDTIVFRSTEQTMDGEWIDDFSDVAKRQIDNVDNRFYLSNDDLLVTKSSGSKKHIGKTTICNTEIEELKACFSNFMQRIRLKSDAHPRYFWYIINNAICKEQFNYISTTTTGLSNLTAAMIGNILVPFPARTIQQAISQYLDQKTSAIDELIADKNKMIKLLREKRQAIISEVVTKGLDRTVPMKDSGIEWIGEVPEPWKHIKFRFIVNRIGDIDHYMPESVDAGVPYIMTGDLCEHTSSIDFESCKQVAYDDYQDLSKKIKAEKGDIIFARYATIGTVCYVDIEKEFLVSYSCVIIKTNNDLMQGRFLYYYLKSTFFSEEIRERTNSNTQGNVGIESLYQCRVVLPSVLEQNKIIKYLDKSCTEIDILITNIETQIDLLKEYRQSIISEVVTGKVAVS